MSGTRDRALRVLGRADEVAAGDALLAGLSDGARALVFEGEPGIGKTTVWREVADRARAGGVTVLSCRAVEAETKLAFVSLADLLAPVAEDVLPSLPGPQRDALQIALLRAAPSSVAVEPRAVGAGVLSVLAALASSSPLLLAVDDVQWFDGASAAALAFALRRLEHRPVGLNATVRVSLAAARDPLGLQEAFGVDLRQHRLGPLSLDQLHQLIHQRLGHALPRPSLQRIQQVSGGNPLFALEFARALVETGRRPEPGEPLPVPLTLGALVEDRVAELSPRCREALLAVASLSAATPAGIEQALGRQAASALAELEAAGLVVLREDKVRFTHPLFATAVYRAAGPARRRALHRRLGELATDIEEQARHVALAADEPDGDAADLLDASAERARARGAPGVAGELLEWAARLTPPEQHRTIGSRTVRSAEHSYRAGDLAHARSLLESALEDSDDRQNRAHALRLLGEIHYNEDSFPEAVASLEQALEHADTVEAAAEILLDLAFAHFSMGDVRQALSASQRAREQAERLPPGPLLGETLAIEANVAFFAGAGLDTQKLERALALEDRSRNVQLLIRPSTIAGLFALYAGKLSDAATRFQELHAWLAERGEDSDCMVLTWLSWTEIWRGNFAAGRTIAEHALSLAEQAGSDPIRGVALMHRAKAAVFLGQETDAREDLRRSAALLDEAGWMVVHAWNRWSLGFLELSLGDHAEAVRVYEPYMRTAEIDGVLEPFAAYFIPDAVEALIIARRLERAERILDIFETRAHQLRRTSALVGASRCRALLLAAQGNTAAADEAIEASLSHADQLEMPFERGRSLLVRGQIHRRSRRKQVARDALGHALAIFEELDAALWADRARAELRRVGHRAEAGQLTATEQRVAELAASGRTNREIAAMVFVSPKTVEANLASIYRKLGIRSRAELGRIMAANEA